MGSIVVKGTAKLGPRARVEGDITSASLAIAEGAVFIGRSIMGEETSQRDQTTQDGESAVASAVASADKPSRVQGRT
jgi:cytoskeletal protein CcmA (bactofilin family)